MTTIKNDNNEKKEIIRDTPIFFCLRLRSITPIPSKIRHTAVLGRIRRILRVLLENCKLSTSPTSDELPRTNEKNPSSEEVRLRIRARLERING